MTSSDGSETPKDFAFATLLALLEDYHSFNPDTTVPNHAYPTDLEFSQQVARGRPCVYRLDRSVLDDQGRESKDERHRDSGDGSPETLSLEEVKRRRLREEQRSILSAPCFRWTKNSLCELVQDEVEVAVTPDGRADALYSLPRRRDRDRPGRDGREGRNVGKRRDGEVDGYGVSKNVSGTDQKIASERDEEGVQEPEAEPEPEREQVFLQPASTYMTLSTLIDHLCPPQPSPSSSTSSPSPSSLPSPSPSPASINTPLITPTSTQPTRPVTPIYYLQSQNSNLHTPPLSALLPSLPGSPPPFSTRVLGVPDAVNIWIGNARSVTSTHRDPYENLYLVVKGRKRFVLYSPLEEMCLHAQRVRTGRWVFGDQSGENRNGDGEGRGNGKSEENGNGNGIGNGHGEGEGEGNGKGEQRFRIVMDDELDDDRDDNGDERGQNGITIKDDHDHYYNAAEEGSFPTPSNQPISPPTIPESNPVDEDTNRIPWIPIDPLSPPPTTSKKYPYYKHARPLSATVSEGEILYLPAGWFHHVSQECGRWEEHDGDGRETVAPCIAVNYWFDMDYSGEKHVMREMVGRLVERTRMNENR